MKINEIIVEDVAADPKGLQKDQVSSIKGAISMPGISSNKSNGNPYQQYRFGLGLAVADGKKGGQMPVAGPFAGDPLLLTFTDEEYNMIKDAAELTDAGPVNKMSDSRSRETDDVHKHSAVPHNAGAHPELEALKKNAGVK